MGGILMGIAKYTIKAERARYCSREALVRRRRPLIMIRLDCA